MEQDEALAAMDSTILSSLVGAGLYNTAIYKPAGIGTTPIEDCTVLIDRSAVYQDAQSGIVSTSIHLTAFHADIGPEQPRKGSTFTVGDEVLVNDRVIELSDESRVVMLVTPRP